MNRLAAATSPYLLQHAQNPVDWWEWGSDAFEEAKRRDVPILLSVGYAACHWCHVMAHESFEDPATAAYLNEHFVSIKVDREERPDVDAVYMAATTAMTGQGGWPMTVVLDHDGNPFFAGTYFPDRPRHGQPAFTQVLQAIAEAWRDRPEEIRGVAENVRRHLQTATAAPAAAPLDVPAVVERLAAEFDPMAGGFGGAPKFPPTMVLEFLRRLAAATTDSMVPTTDSTVLTTDSAVPATDSRVRHMLDRTVAAMARGGLYDQIGGGFARYSVDRGWAVPHFEKMLSDQCLLSRVYSRLGVHNESHSPTARETLDFMLRELRTPQGGFAASLDADTEGVEGRFYVWTPEQLVEALGVERGKWAAELFAVTPEGTFERGASTLQLRHGIPKGEERRFEEVRARLFEARALRTPPARDDKVVAAWNGLAISALVDGWFALGNEKYLSAAIENAELLRSLHTVEPGRLRRVSREGRVSPIEGVLEDYACVAAGYLDLLCATADPQWLAAARDLLDAALDRFRADDGGFYDTADDAELLVARPREFTDNATPSGQSAMVNALLTFAAITGEGRYRTAAEEALAVLSAVAGQAPRFAGWALVAAQRMQDECEVAVVGSPSPERDALVATARALPGSTVVVSDSPTDEIPLLSQRGPVEDRPAAYLCRGMVCELPVTTPDALRAHGRRT
ncbi:MAG: thioredoxin domain-containing protein [Nocardioides sp.]|uniref:thioredoxin domain-containing protein n=1 Tax=Nocardioides sp. TaxID=35761 RepID=UPI0039E31A71